jgi:hypothetical protein
VGYIRLFALWVLNSSNGSLALEEESCLDVRDETIEGFLRVNMYEKENCTVF